MAKDLKLGLVLGYWFAGPPTGVAEQIRAAEELGFDSVWTAEAYGSDCFTPLAWCGAATTTLKLGTGVCQLSARTPVATAMTALTLDHLSGGRVILGLGASGPQVVEGWYGQPFPKPLARTREVVAIIRKVLARQHAPLVDAHLANSLRERRIEERRSPGAHEAAVPSGPAKPTMTNTTTNTRRTMQ